MQHQPHEPFFSFTVPPKPNSNSTITSNSNSNSNSNLIQPYPSPASNQHTLLHHPSSHLQLQLQLQPQPQPPSRSPSFPSPTEQNSHSAGRFAFNVPSNAPDAILPSLPLPQQLSTPTNSLLPVLDRPYSCSGLPASTHFAQTLNNSQTFASSHHAPGPHDVLKSATRSSFPNSDFPSPLLTTPNGPRLYAYPPQPTELLASEIMPTTASSQAESTHPNHLVNSSPGSSSLLAGFGDTIDRAPLGSSSGSSDPESRLHGSNAGECSIDHSAHPNPPHRSVSGSGRPSVGTHSSESTPESPESLDGGDHHHPLNYLHSTNSNHFDHLLRPSTHSGTSASFGEEKFLSQPLQPRPATGYLHHYEPPPAYSPLHSQFHQYPPRFPPYPPHSSHIYANSPGHHAHAPGPTEPKGHDRLYNFTILPGAPRKRARRRFDEVERLYCCNYPGCTKGYGTLNHLNAHISMQKHGPKRLPQEFKEIRKEWRAKKKAESDARAAMKQSPVNVRPAHEFGAFGNQDAFRRPHTGFSSNSSPGCASASACASLAHVPTPAVSGLYSAPAHSQSFTVPDRHDDWHQDYRINTGTIAEQPEYIGSSSSHDSPSSLLPNQSIPSSTSSGSASFGDQHYTPQHQVVAGPPLDSTTHRPSQLLLNHHSPSIVDRSYKSWNRLVS